MIALIADRVVRRERVDREAVPVRRQPHLGLQYQRFPPKQGLARGRELQWEATRVHVSCVL